jgi:hypothetical protein
MAMLGEKLGDGPADHSAGMEIVSGALFSGAVGSVQRCWWPVKGCHVRGPPVGSVRCAYVDCRGKHTCRVGWVFPYRLYIDSNHHDPQI